MTIVIIADEPLRLELTGDAPLKDSRFVWMEGTDGLTPCDVCIDLLFQPNEKRINELKNTGAECIIINAVDTTLNELPENFARINAWPGFLKKELIETAAPDKLFEQVEKIFSLFRKKTERVPDIKGFITARVISMVINEAYFALEENLSSREEIDLAMKLGTNYPHGPFEWAQLIGHEKIYSLLDKLSHEDPRYTPATLLENEINS